jgi:hypothetical protein
MITYKIVLHVTIIQTEPDSYPEEYPSPDLVLFIQCEDLEEATHSATDYAKRLSYPPEGKYGYSEHVRVALVLEEL